jgi:methanogenic corrinoid protein MtbC1
VYAQGNVVKEDCKTQNIECSEANMKTMNKDANKILNTTIYANEEAMNVELARIEESKLTYFYVLERSLKEVGRLWEMNIMDVSQEQYFSNVTDFLEAKGWDTYYLGSDIPTQNVIRALQDPKANMLVISATMSFNLDSVSSLIKTVRSSKGCKNVKIMVGGRAFNVSKQLWKVVDADGYAGTAQETVKIAEKLMLEYS